MINQMLKVAIILGSSRPGRNGEAVSQWIYELAKNREDADFELIDIVYYHIPILLMVVCHITYIIYYF